MAGPQAEQTTVIVCEDIRREESGRLSLMGVYGPSIEVARTPIRLPSLCCALILLNPRRAVGVRMRIVGPDKKEVARVDAPSPASYPPPPFVSAHQFRVFPFPIEMPGAYEISFSFEGDDPGSETLVHRIAVRVATPPAEGAGAPSI